VLDPELGAVLKAAVEAREQALLREDIREAKELAGQPALEVVADADEESHEPPSSGGLALDRTPSQRRADALGDLVLAGDGVLTGSTGDRLGGPATQLHVTAPIETVVEAAVARARRTLRLPGLDRDDDGTGRIDDDPRPVVSLAEGEPVRRLLADGMRPRTGLLHRVAAAVDDAVDRALGTERAVLDDHDHPVDDGLLGLLACDCVLQRIVLDAQGVPIDLGRSQRLISRKQRRLLRRRDGGCAFPCCDRPASWCDAHHIVPWEIGGPTDLDNLVLLCRRHHRLLHLKVPWLCRVDPTTRRPTFFRPDGTPAPQPGLPPRTGPPDRPPARSPGAELPQVA
jgi:hypothetical protein